MSTVFDAILRREVPAQVVWEDAEALAFLDHRPHTPGHTLIIPLRDVGHWTDLSDSEGSHVFWVAKQIGQAQIDAFHAERIGMVIAGYHVPHVHIHVLPTTDGSQLDFSALPEMASPNSLVDNGARLRRALRRRGHSQQVPPEE